MEGRRGGGGGGAYSNYGHGGNGGGSAGRGRARNQRDQSNQGVQYQHRGIGGGRGRGTHHVGGGQENRSPVPAAAGGGGRGGGRGRGIHHVGSDCANRPPIPPAAAVAAADGAAVGPTAGGSVWTGRPVSLVPPVKYADLVAYRGRLYQQAVASSSPSDDPFDQNFYTLHPDLRNVMFFV